MAALYFCLCFVLYPAINLYAVNVSEVGVFDVLPTLLGLVIVAIALFFSFRWLLQCSVKSGLVISILSFCFFSYTHLLHYKGLLKTVGLRLSNDVVLIGLIVFAVLLSLLVVLTKKNLKSLVAPLSIIASVLIVVPLFNIISYSFTRSENSSKNTVQTSKSLSPAQSTVASPAALPDIYYIILDAYGRNDTFKKLYDFSNDSFTKSLQAKGFWVGRKSCANYPRTFLSLASSLNMMYLDKVAENAAKTYAPKDYSAYIDLVKNSSVFSTLKHHGYTFINIGSWSPVSKHLDMADENLLGAYKEFPTLLMEESMLQKFAKVTLEYEARRAHVLYQFAQLQDVSKRQSSFPKVVFTHIISPHHPYLFNEDGSRSHYVEDWRQTKAHPELIKGYARQVKYVNKRVLESIETILSHAKTPPVIIIQGDHGPKNHGSFSTEPWEQPFLNERTPILNAYYLPQVDTTKLPENTSPVNTFRIVLGQYLKQELPLLENRVMFFNPNNAYHHTDVTSQVDCGLPL